MFKIDPTDYIQKAKRLLETAQGEAEPTRGALERLSAVYFRSAVEGLAPVNDNDMAMGESNYALPRPH